LVEARQRFEVGMTAEDAADDIELIEFRDWGDPERIAVNVETLYAVPSGCIRAQAVVLHR
jgi:cyclase